MFLCCNIVNFNDFVKSIKFPNNVILIPSASSGQALSKDQANQWVIESFDYAQDDRFRLFMNLLILNSLNYSKVFFEKF